ncbi:MAG: hypothetical protein A2V63_00115 [Candidatus Eisenbacteria bacterium RBG_19FT_COMBO_70_11]|nr:MAG: hypothetical protein A2V63_00115 [Candidatus Eisenbacteria bacterium RBG_19FT_COMBO_70_11]
MLVLPGWLLLVVAPGWRRTTRLIAGVLIPLLLAALYVYLVVTHLFGAEGGFGTLADVSLLFQNPYLLLAGWVHYLALDLFVAAWEVRDARRLGIPHLLVIPCLALTFLFGPAGLLLYILLRAISKRVVTVGGAHTPR